MVDLRPRAFPLFGAGRLLTVFDPGLGNFVGPLLFKEPDAPRYEPGFIAVFATTVATAVIAVLYRCLSVWENTKRDRLGVESYEHAYDDDLTDTKVSLRSQRMLVAKLTSA